MIFQMYSYSNKLKLLYFSILCISAKHCLTPWRNVIKAKEKVQSHIHAVWMTEPLIQMKKLKKNAQVGKEVNPRSLFQGKVSYETFSDLVKHSYNAIDVVFF